jgi:hypothetical protein
MSGSGKGTDNRGNNRKKPFKHRDTAGQDNVRQDFSRQGTKKPDVQTGRESARFDKNRGGLFERPRWVAPKLPSDPLPVLDCPYCGKPIKDIASAIADKNNGVPVHFDCIIARIGEGETLEQGDAVAYIGGGRFGVVHFGSPQDNRNFTIKKILEWENKENRAEWRDTISDHYSMT